MNYFTLVVVFVALFAKLSAGQECNEKGMRKFDTKMARLISIGNSGRTLPTTKGAPFKKWCSETDQLLKEMDIYKTKCFKDLAKQTFGVLLYAVKNAFRFYCKKDSQKLTDLVNAAPCVIKNDLAVTKCYTNMIDGIIGSQNAPDNKKIPHLCCEYSRIFQCFEDKLAKAPSCNGKNIETLNDLIRSIVGNVVDLLCGDYTEGSDKCENLGPAPKKKKNQRRTKSFAPPLLDLLYSFPAV